MDNQVKQLREIVIQKNIICIAENWTAVFGKNLMKKALLL